MKTTDEIRMNLSAKQAREISKGKDRMKKIRTFLNRISNFIEYEAEKGKTQLFVNLHGDIRSKTIGIIQKALNSAGYSAYMIEDREEGARNLCWDDEGTFTYRFRISWDDSEESIHSREEDVNA